MDPNIALVVAALASGAMESITEQTIKATYMRLKTLVRRNYNDVSLEPLEQEPESVAVREAVGEQLSTTSAANNDELLKLAKEILDLVEQYAPQEAKAAGIEVRKIKADYAKFGKLRAEGSVVFEELELKGGLETGNIEAGIEKKKRSQ